MLPCASTVPRGVPECSDPPKGDVDGEGVGLILFWSELDSASAGTCVWTKSETNLK